MTDSSLHARARRLFDRALELEPSARSAYLDRECSADDELRQEVEALLRHHVEAPADFISPPEPEAEDPIEGLRLAEFELREELGRGAMGVVYRAHQPSLGRDVAVKVLVESLATTPQQLERFHREARAIAKLEHDHIARVLANGQHERIHWFAMELIDGRDLDSELEVLSGRTADRHRTPILPAADDRGYVREVAKLVADAADALAHAHHRGIVHRDIKPSNLLLTADGKIKLVDFGIARDQALGTLTQPNQAVGSLPYMSPEQARLVDLEVDERTDIYSLGVVLYELLTLERPFRGATSHELFQKIRNAEPAPVRRLNRRVPRDLAIVCNQAMSKLPSERYRSALALAEDLVRFLDHESIEAQPPSWGRRFGRRIARHRVSLSVVGGVLIAGLASSWWSTKTAKAAALDHRLRPLRELAATEDWETLPIARLAAAKQTLTELAAQPTQLAGELRADLQRRFSELRRTWRARGDAEALAGLAAKDQDGNSAPIDVQRFVTGHRTLQRLATLFPETEPLQLETLLLPRLSLDAVDTAGGPLGGRVSYRQIDPTTALAQPAVDLGPLPLIDRTLPIGYLRLQIETADGVRHEWVREFETAEVDTLRVESSSTRQSSTQDMLRLAGGTLTLGAQESSAPFRGREVVVEPFWLDTTEVSNGAYREFLQSQPADYPRPVYWSRIEPGSAEDRLPVTWITWRQARRYAEWLGKRLPSLAEWTWAARGPSARRFPWDGDDWRGNTRRGSIQSLIGDPDALSTAYLQQAEAVTSMPEAASPAGVLHLFGNVAEWTESHVCEPGPNYRARYYAGSAWDSRVDDRRLDLALSLTTRDIGPNSSWITIGFRCARSTTR